MAGSPGYYDEAGKWVPGVDPNYHSRDYSCSRGHRFGVTTKEGSPDRVTRYPDAQPPVVITNILFP